MDKKQALMSKERYDAADLCDIMELLRAPDGCPWDREQTHASIRNNFIEETYEAVEAIDLENPEMLREELGDVLLQVVFHSRLSEEAGEFNFSDVVTEVCQKLIKRHPHIFGEVKVSGTDDVLRNWDAIKQASHGRKTVSEALEGVSKALPALMLASKLSGKAVKYGAELPDARLHRYDGVPDEELERRVGDELFDIAASANSRGVEAEQALYNACVRFIGAYGSSDGLGEVKSAEK